MTTAAPAAPAARVGRIFSLLLGGEMVNKVARFAAAALLARTLTPDAFGEFNVGIAVAGIAVTATTLGLPEVMGRAVARSPEDAADHAGRVLALRVLVLGTIVVVGSAVATLGGDARPGVVLATAAMALAMSSSADWVARGLGRAGGLGTATATGGGVALAGAALLSITGGTSASALGVFALAELVAAVLTWVLVRLRPRLSLRGWRPMLQRSWPVALSSFVIYSYYANIDTILISAFRSSAEAGLYSGAYRVFVTFNAVAIFVAYANFPGLSRADASDSGAVSGAEATLHRSVVALAVLGSLVSAVAVLAGGELLALVFGPDFVTTGDTFIILCAGLAWYLIGYPLGYGLMARGDNFRFLAGASAAGIIGLGLDLALIPPFGMFGAGIATAAAFSCAAAIWLSGHGRPLQRFGPVLGVTVLGTVCSVLALLAPGVRPEMAAVLLLAAVGLGSTLARSSSR